MNTLLRKNYDSLVSDLMQPEKKRRRIHPKWPILFTAVILLFGSYLIYHAQTCQTHYPSWNHKENMVGPTSEPDWSSYAFAVKTGQDIASARLPILLSTYLSRVENKIIIGETPGMAINGMPMLDVYTHLYDGLVDEDGSELRFTPHQKQKTPTPSLDIQQSVPNEESKGWLADAHKNLPGFRELFRRFPEAKWYMMVDDDSYVFLDNLDSFLQDFNSSLPYYFGAGNTFSDCDGVQSWRHSTAFAHGGSGILVSRGAMLRLQSLWEFCIVRYHGASRRVLTIDCWAGDVRLGLCLRDAGVLLTNVKGFHTNPPNDLTVYGHPCSRPLTFHHLLPTQIQKLYEFELGATQNNPVAKITMADLMPEWLDSIPRTNTNRKGDEYKTVLVRDLNACIERCRTDPACMAYSFKDRACALKRKVNILEKESGSTSGVMLSNFQCNAKHQATYTKHTDLGL
ncbi:hypothetical protein HDU91_002088 [Kappamyces sp. JEL0680]|nr:hypothetical protein HDU91_002088 [Kappamyces sp. JEL0680]